MASLQVTVFEINKLKKGEGRRVVESIIFTDNFLLLQDGPFQWSAIDQGLVLGCYFYGYILSGIPGAWLSRRWGFRLVIGMAFILSSIFTIITPFAAWYKLEMLVASRIALGFVQVVIVITKFQ